jgi:hypothetical protein
MDTCKDKLGTTKSDKSSVLGYLSPFRKKEDVEKIKKELEEKTAKIKELDFNK